MAKNISSVGYLELNPLFIIISYHVVVASTCDFELSVIEHK